jgi:hypothetical protein
VELNSRKLGGNALLIPSADTMLVSTTCRQMLQEVVLSEQLHQPDLLATVEKVSIFAIKQHDNVSSSDMKTRVDKNLANATTCMDMSMISVIESLSTQYFTFKLTSSKVDRSTPSKSSSKCLRGYEARPNIVCLSACATRAFSDVCQPLHIQRLVGLARGAPTRLDKGLCQ